MHQQQANAEDDYQTGVEPNEINRLICAPRCHCRVHSYVMIRFLVFVLLVILALIILYTKSSSRPASHSHIPRDSTGNAVLPRQTSITDWGHSTRFHGWVDVQNQGVPNDYARYVGPNNEHRYPYLSVALAGSTEQYTEPGLYEERSGIVQRTKIKPRQRIPDIDKLGLPNYFRGWVDVQNQGVANDYAYYVGPTEDIPFAWLTVALAGSSHRRTCAGLFFEKYGVVRPALGEMHYKQSIDISCQYLQSMIREVYGTSSNDDLFRLNSFSDFSQLAMKQIKIDNLSEKNSSGAVLTIVSSQSIPRNVYKTRTSMDIMNSSPCTNLFSKLLLVMIVLVMFHYIFRFTTIFLPLPL